MKKQAFLNLTKDEVLEKIKIDARLIPSFKRVMTKMQTLFDAYGFSEVKDYGAFFKTYLIDHDFEIQINQEPSQIGAVGFYNKFEKRIVIDENTLSSKFLEATIFHEFIHFIVNHDLKREEADENIFRGGFINEALTEMLTELAYGVTYSYQPQVMMMRFANLLSGNINNYRAFLKGGIDSKLSSSSWMNFISYVESYQNDFKGKPYVMETAKKNQNYMNAQRCLISLFARVTKDMTIDDYLAKTSALLKAPVLEDKEYISNHLAKMDQDYIATVLKVRERDKMDFLLAKLKKLRALDEKIEKYQTDEIYEVSLGDRVIAITKDMKIKCDNEVGLVITRSPMDKEISIYDMKNPNEKITLHMDELSFDGVKKEREALKKYVQKDAVIDMTKLDNLESGVTKIEKFTLPVVGMVKEKPKTVYIAYKGKEAFVLDDLRYVKEVGKMKQMHYIGVTSKENGAIYMDSIKTVDGGYLFSTLNEKAIKSKSISLLYSKLSKELEEAEKEKIIASYKKSADYDLEETEEDTKYFALWNYSERKYDQLEGKDKKNLEQSVIEQAPSFVVSITKGGLEVSKMYVHGMMFQAKKEVLVDQKEKGIYQDYFDMKQQEKNILKAQKESRKLAEEAVNSNQEVAKSNKGTRI